MPHPQTSQLQYKGTGTKVQRILHILFPPAFRPAPDGPRAKRAFPRSRQKERESPQCQCARVREKEKRGDISFLPIRTDGAIFLSSLFPPLLYFISPYRTGC